MQQKKLDDQQCCDNWDTFLKVFKKIEQERPKDYVAQLEKLKTKAQNTVQLTVRQREGIIDRCTNVINGTYGNSKKPEHYGQSKIH